VCLGGILGFLGGRVFLIVTLAFTFAGCSSQDRGGYIAEESDSAKRNGRGSTSSGSNDLLTYCHVFNSGAGNGNFRGAVSTVSYSNQVIHLNFTANPTGFTDSDNVIKLQRWRATSAFVSTPEDIDFQLEVPGTIPLSSPYDSLNKADLDDNFFGSPISSVQLVIDDLPAEYQVLRILLESDSGTLLDFFDVLLPEFTVDPNKFAAKAPSTLHPLHPLEPYYTTNYSEATYLSILDRSHPYCY